MHIPDGFLNIEVALATYIAAALILVIALKRAKKIMGEKHVPLLSVLAAGVFSAQMLNFPLIGIGGTSGHFLGAALSAIVLGPYGAVIVMALVLVVQALVFADGGITALGANVVNMGVVGGFGAYVVYYMLLRTTKNVWAAAFFAGWASVVFAAAMCAIEIGLSEMSEIMTVLFAMIPIYAVMGVIEGAVTAGVLTAIQRTRQDILALEKI